MIVGGVLSFSLAFMLADAHATDRSSKHAAAVTVEATAASETPPPPATAATPEPAPAPAVHPSFAALSKAVEAIVSRSGAQVGVSLIELGGAAPSSWSRAGATPMDAASTYKLPALMAEAQLIAEGNANPAANVCFVDSDWEDGWYDDYAAGECYSRDELAKRAGIYSDNTAGHMLVRDIGGPSVLNAYAIGLGAQDSTFFDVNQTTSDDLARLLAAEAMGNAGGKQAQVWLYPNLSKTRFEAGIPAGLPAGTLVIHKTGELDSEVNDAAIVSGRNSGAYVLVVMTDGPGGDAAWSLVAQVSAAAWAYEGTR